MQTAAQLAEMFRQDLPDYLLGTVLCTIGCGVAILGARSRGKALVAAGVFAFLYGARMLVRTGSTALLLGDPAWLPYVTAALEYIMPIPASAVFAFYLGEHWWRLNRVTIAVFAAVAAIAIPYELATHQPYAANRLVNAFVVVLISIFFLNFAVHPSLVRNIVTAGALVFALFVLNEHFRLVNAPLGLAREPAGFLIFIGTILYDLMRRAEQARWRLAAVESELATARRIQESILPRSAPEVDGVDVASVYLPASSVAGDYFDYIDAGDGCFGVLVADVSGHGVGAALVASMLKVAIAMKAEHVHDPARLLEELNAFFCGKLTRQFITAAVAFVDARSGRVSVATAGHPPPLVLRADGSIEEVEEASGFVLGRMRAARFHGATLALGPGDGLVFYTDGVTEARRHEEDFGVERLRAAARETSAGEIAEGITRAVRAWAGSEFEDDVTLVVVRFSPSPV